MQLELDLALPVTKCDHAYFYTLAYVPGGLCCLKCGMLFWQSLPVPPGVLGYVSADWAWKNIDGKEWTTKELPDSIFKQYANS